MFQEMENPVAAATANRVLEIKAYHSIDVQNSTEAAPEFQAAIIVAARYHLSPVRARIVCELAGIGRAA